MDDEVPILDEENYSTWRIEMRVYLKTMGATIWKATIGGYVPLKNERRMMHWLSIQFLVDSQTLSKRAWDNALPPRIYG